MVAIYLDKCASIQTSINSPTHAFFLRNRHCNNLVNNPFLSCIYLFCISLNIIVKRVSVSIKVTLK